MDCQILRKPKPVITYVTNNATNAPEVITFLQDFFNVSAQDMNLPAPNRPGEEFIAIKAREASMDTNNGPAIVEDFFLQFTQAGDILSEKPDIPYTWYVHGMTRRDWQTVFAEPRYQTVCIVSLFAYCPGESGKVELFKGYLVGKLIRPGQITDSWERCIKPDRQSVVYGDLPRDIQESISPQRAALARLKAHVMASRTGCLVTKAQKLVTK